jgi:hypothetical protein
MLFDLEDYFSSGGIGQYNRPPYASPYGDKGDYLGTARETRNAFLKAVNEWFLASTAWHPPYTCTPNPDSYYYGEFQDAYINYMIKYLIFVNAYAGGCNEINFDPPCTGTLPVTGIHTLTLTKLVPVLIPITGNTWLFEPENFDFPQDIDFGNYENLTEEVLNDYITASQEFMCALKKLIKITVGSDIEDVVNVPDFIFTPTL